MMKTVAGVGLFTVVLAVGGFFVAGCATSTFDPAAARAQEGAPVAAQVDVISLPYDANLPRFVVAVEPLDYSASGQISGGGVPAQTTNIGKGLGAQLMTALSNWGNVSLLDHAALVRKDDGTYSCKLQPGEIGPFIVKGTVTEFNETAEASERTRGADLGRVGAIAGITGAITGSRDLARAGGLVAAADPTIAKGKMNRKGMVGMDLQVVDGRSARIIRSYNSSGTFATVSEVSGMSVFGIGGTNRQFAASALGQATRAAMNDAVRKTADALRTAPR